jgi:hypothetical protein
MVGAVSTRGRCPSRLSAEAGGVESTEAPEGSKIPTPTADFRFRAALSGGFSLRCAASQSFGLTTGDYVETGQILRGEAPHSEGGINDWLNADSLREPEQRCQADPS